MRPITFIVLTVWMSLLTGRLLAGNQPAAEDELTKIKREYGDVLALQGTSKGEILAMAKISLFEVPCRVRTSPYSRLILVSSFSAAG